MRIGTLASQLGTTTHAIRFYERRGLLPAPGRSGNGYREYSEADAERLRLLIGLRHLDVPLHQAAELASDCRGFGHDPKRPLHSCSSLMTQREGIDNGEARIGITEGHQGGR